jgi:hypothetical protein
MSEGKSEGKKLGQSDTKRTSKYSVNPRNWSRRTTTSVIMISVLSVILIPMLVNMDLLTGAFRTIEVEDDTYHIGFYTLDFEFRNSTNELETDVTITVDLINYYTNEKIEEDYVMNSSTVYETTNVTLLYLKSVSGLIDTTAEYRQGAYLIYTNETREYAYENIIYESMKGKVADFELSIYELDDSYGSFGVGDISDTDFTISLALKNNGNGTFSEQKVIPEPYRYNINISNSAFWWKFDCIVQNITLVSDGEENYNYRQDLYYDYDNGHTYMIMPYMYRYFDGTYQFYIEADAIPTSFEFIQGQWDGDVILALP